MYNILFLGETQSGKRTLVEFIKNYADPGYIVNNENIGDGIFECAKIVSATTINSNVPSCFVSEARERIDYGSFLGSNQENYEDQLHEREKCRLEREQLTTNRDTFNLIDTPDLNDTNLFDDSNIAIIFKALESIEVVNLVVITIANNPFTEDLKRALEGYLNLLPELKTNVVFVHTKIDCAKLHSQEEDFVSNFQEKKRILNNLVGRGGVPHVLIDNDLGSQRTIRNCITQNTLRELLTMAKLNQPVRICAHSQSSEHVLNRSLAPSRLRHKIILVGDKDPATVASVHCGRDWTAVNTYGLHGLEGRGVRGSDQAIRTLKRALLESRGGCQYLAFVANASRIFAHGDGECHGDCGGDCHGDASARGKDTVDDKTDENHGLFKLFCKTFAGAEKRFVVVMTHYPVKDANRRKEELIRLEAQLRMLPREVAVPWLALDGSSGEPRSTGARIGGKGVVVLVQEDALDAEKEFEQALSKFLGVGGFIVAVLLNLAKFFSMY
ncbi:hypothetical protein BGZ82_010281 [Podila clonocystis]|nr:hypothetical protein BGZ82_010281 [Podila clonocystis]